MRADLTPPVAGTALFFRYGSFSHSNDAVVSGLRTHFPGVEIVDIDLKARVAANRVGVTLSLAEVAIRYGPKRLAASGGKALALRTVRGWRLLRDAARAATREAIGAAAPLFTLQTQTVFDAHSGRAPHFVYTDHAHLTNLSYPGFEARNLLAPTWIAAETAALGRATRTFVMSRHVEQSLVDLYHLDPARVTLVGVGQNSPPPPVVARAPAMVLFVGVDWERKGGPTLIAAFDQIARRRPDARLVVVGCSPDVRRPYLEIVGKVPLAQVADHYARSTLFCLPTRIEPFGIVAIEAMAAGLAPVLPRLGAFPDFVRDGETGFLFRPDDADDLARVLDAALADPARLAAIGARGQAVVARDYAWGPVLGRIASHIRADLAGG